MTLAKHKPTLATVIVSCYLHITFATTLNIDTLKLALTLYLAVPQQHSKQPPICYSILITINAYNLFLSKYHIHNFARKLESHTRTHTQYYQHLFYSIPITTNAYKLFKSKYYVRNFAWKLESPIHTDTQSCHQFSTQFPSLPIHTSYSSPNITLATLRGNLSHIYNLTLQLPVQVQY